MEEGRPPSPQSGTRRCGANSPAVTGSLRSPSLTPLTPHKRSSSLSQTGSEGDPLINPTAEMVVHQRPSPVTLPDLSSIEGSANKQSLPPSSADDQGKEDPLELCRKSVDLQVGGMRLRAASPSTRPGTLQRGPGAEPAVVVQSELAARTAESSMGRGSEVLLALERLSGSGSPGQVVMGVHDAQPDRSSLQTKCVRGSMIDMPPLLNSSDDDDLYVAQPAARPKPAKSDVRDDVGISVAHPAGSAVADDTVLSVGSDTGDGDPAAGTSAAWSGESLAEESNSGPAFSAATTLRRRPAASKVHDSKSTGGGGGGGGESTASATSGLSQRGWINFPRDILLAFGVTEFGDAPAASSQWSWDQDSDRNPSAEIFVCEDETHVLRHITYLGGLCLRQDIRGPIGLMLSSELSHRSVPEFSTFWSSTPVSASLGKKSIKVLLLILSIGFTYMADLSKVLFLLRGNNAWDWYGKMKVAGAQLLDITTNPRDAALSARRPWRLTKAGAVVGRPSWALRIPQPYGFVDHLVSNYTVHSETQHSFIFSEPVDFNTKYMELQGAHASKQQYWAFVWSVWWFISENELKEEFGQTPEQYQADYAKIMIDFEARFRAMSYEERLQNDNKIFYYGAKKKMKYFRKLYRIAQGWDGKERFVQADGIADRKIVGIWIQVAIAISSWLACVNSLCGYKAAAKKSIVLILALHCLSVLILVGMDLKTLSEAEGADSWEVIAFAIHNNLCCGSRPHVELDTEEGRSTRKAMMRDGLAIIVCRALQVLSAPFLMTSLWVERHVLLSVSCYFGILFLYHGIVLPAVSPREFSTAMLLISVVGFLFPQFIWWRLASIRRSVKKMINEDVVVWEELYSGTHS